MGHLSRRLLLQIAGLSGLGLLVRGPRPAAAQASRQAFDPLPEFTGPGANPYWNGTIPFAVYPQKVPLLRLTDRPPQLETPRDYFLDPFTPNAAFFVRYHLSLVPNDLKLEDWRLTVEGNVAQPVQLSFGELVKGFRPVSIAAVNQCSGNSRSRFAPRVAGGQWGNGAMGNALWTGVRLRDILDRVQPRTGTVQIQFQGLDLGPGPEGKGSHAFIKSLDAKDPILDQAIVAYLMNGEPLPMLNGFPARLIVPGRFATYWMKHLAWIRALTQEDRNFWMDPAYRVPDTPRGDTTPADVSAGRVRMLPIGRMPVRSFIVRPDGSAPLPAGLPVAVRGIAFSGYGRVTKVEFSEDDGRTWMPATVGTDHGPYAFRAWEHTWAPARRGRYVLAVRATDEAGNVQPDQGVWNPGGYLWNKIERQEVTAI